MYDLESWNKSTQLPPAVEHGPERFYLHGSVYDGTAPGLVPGSLVGDDQARGVAALDAREVGS